MEHTPLQGGINAARNNCDKCKGYEGLCKAKTLW